MAGPLPTARYADSGGLSIAYATYGEGPFDVVFVPGFVSHVEMGWELGYGSIRRRIGEFARLIFFDKRGTGMSDRAAGIATLEERMDDVRAVMDAAGSERAALVGLSEGGPLSLVFAATYPERVSSLVLWGTSACFREAEGYPVEIPEFWKDMPDLMADSWGSGEVISMLVRRHPELSPARKADLLAETARFERNWATPTAVRQLMRMNVELDCRGVLPSISAPTLVLHRKDDPAVPVAHGRWLADHIPGARFQELPGDFHFGGLPGDDDDLLDHVEEFLTGTRSTTTLPDRVLKTVLFTDIVGSTEQVSRLGDHQWRRVLDNADQLVHREVAQSGGQLVKSTGDGHLATFDGPARAVRCASSVQRAVERLGVELRAGLHTGEVELRGDDVGGIAVHIGARVAALAGPGEVLCSRTVVDLVAGSGLEFEERGPHSLRGVSGEWQLFAARA